MQMANKEQITQVLRGHGLRATPQRAAIGVCLLARHRHCTPQVIYEELRGAYPSLSLNTVYTTLAQMAELGLIRSLHIEGRTIYDSNTDPHDHAHCRNCGTLVDMTAPASDQMPSGLKGWKLDGVTRVWSGLCPVCDDRSSDGQLTR